MIPVVVAVLLTGATGAAATTGVAVDLGAVDVEDTLLPGQGYTLPRIGVRNPGSEMATIEMAVMPLEGRPEPPSEWFRFEPDRFTLQPGESRAVGVEIQLAPDAAPGDYETLLAASLASGEEPGTAVGAAAASRLSFIVRPTSLLHAWLLALGSFLTRYAPWSYAVPGLVVLALFVRRFSTRFAIAIERKP